MCTFALTREREDRDGNDDNDGTVVPDEEEDCDDGPDEPNDPSGPGSDPDDPELLILSRSMNGYEIHRYYSKIYLRYRSLYLFRMNLMQASK